jgi:hypothetical protein
VARPVVLFRSGIPRTEAQGRPAGIRSPEFILRTILAQQGEWREVSREELQMKTSRVEPDADAEAIFWEVHVDDSSEYELVRKHYVRVKIFTERGQEKYSKIDIPFRKGVKIKDLVARVVKPDGSTIEISEKDVFEREIVKTSGTKVKAKSFVVPGIAPGVVVEYRYREIIPNAGTVGMILEFQKDIPIQSLTYYYKPFSQKEPKYYGYRVDGVNFVKAEKGFFVAKRENIPAFREEPYMPPEDAVRPWIKLRRRTYSFLAVTASVFGIDPSSFLTKYTAKDPSNPQYWGIFAGENSHFVKFIIKENKEIRKVAEEITASAKTDDEKLRAIYEFCQRQIRNLSFEPADSIAEDEAKKLRKIDSIGDILKNRKGYSAHIDMLFGAMASSLGYEVRIAFASDRSELFFDPAVNDEDLVRPAAIAVKVGNQWKLFNPGVKFLPYGMLLWYEEDTRTT